MSSDLKKPYLIIPRLVEQPTWGGTYIASYKGIRDKNLQERKIGQSYELFGESLLSPASSTADSQFRQDLLQYNTAQGLEPDSENIKLADIIATDPTGILGPSLHTSTMPLLIKFTQALGNSFQIHVNKTQKSTRWKPKPESWYYLEDGIITFGLKKGINIDEYKTACKTIENKMLELSSQVKNRSLSFKEARDKSQQFIKEINPWQFVNVHKVKKHSIVDLSSGAIQHSWEEDPLLYPLGNVLYEVQLDVTDDDSTIRSFDKGKIQPDGTVRNIHIDDYFAHIDTLPEHNDLNLAMRKRDGRSLLDTPHYSLDVETIQKDTVTETKSSFIHIFVLEGGASIETSTRTLSVERGYSCFIPFGVKAFSITPLQEKTIILKTYIR